MPPPVTAETAPPFPAPVMDHDALIPIAGEDPRIPVGHYPTWTDAQEHALVILSLNLSTEVELDGAPGGYVIYADADRADAISHQLAAYDDLHRDATTPSPAPELPRFGSGAWMTIAWASVLLWAFLRQSHDTGFTDWAASSSHGLIDSGEWWRPFTALFLHADLDHLLGNLAAGILFATLLCRSIGPMTAWGLTLASGVLGNILTAAIHHPEPFTAIGASTAVFGALGGLTGFGVAAAVRHPAGAPWSSILLPLGGGAAMLGWLGTGGVNTDLLGHLTGFLAGGVLGVAAGLWRLRESAGRETDAGRGAGAAVRS